mmetsp:Transcript_131614/g.421042  ORF Transcript_131614/g.421042 Transcript_131614/m.421042 type:complete len:247 (-) Transcript_131614:439-1179(-)
MTAGICAQRTEDCLLEELLQKLLVGGELAHVDDRHVAEDRHVRHRGTRQRGAGEARLRVALADVDDDGGEAAQGPEVLRHIEGEAQRSPTLSHALRAAAQRGQLRDEPAVQGAQRTQVALELVLPDLLSPTQKSALAARAPQPEHVGGGQEGRDAELRVVGQAAPAQAVARGRWTPMPLLQSLQSQLSGRILSVPERLPQIRPGPRPKPQHLPRRRPSDQRLAEQGDVVPLGWPLPACGLGVLREA